MDIRLNIDGWTCIWLAILLLVIPLNWAAAVIAAAIFHELCHLTAILLSGGRILQMDIKFCGIIMTADAMHPRQELLCAAAGPAGSLILLIFSRWFPELALCGLVHGIYNLFPIYPLDGGRCLYCLCRLFSRKSEHIFCRIQTFCLCILCLAGVYFCFFRKIGMIPLFLCLGLVYRGFTGKIPCKESVHAVQ